MKRLKQNALGLILELPLITQLKYAPLTSQTQQGGPQTPIVYTCTSASIGVQGWTQSVQQ